MTEREANGAGYIADYGEAVPPPFEKQGFKRKQKDRLAEKYGADFLVLKIVKVNLKIWQLSRHFLLNR
jgi:hypothetical protein